MLNPHLIVDAMFSFLRLFFFLANKTFDHQVAARFSVVFVFVCRFEVTSTIGHGACSCSHCITPKRKLIPIEKDQVNAPIHFYDSYLLQSKKSLFFPSFQLIKLGKMESLIFFEITILLFLFFLILFSSS